MNNATKDLMVPNSDTGFKVSHFILFSSPQSKRENPSYFESQPVAERWVTELEPLGCVAGERMGMETRINLAASFMNGGGFDLDPGSQTAGYAWDAWGMKMCLG
jgi:hypothetical protein